MDLTMIGMVLLALGILLLGIEMMVPGFGAPGIGGIISIIVGIFLAARTVEEGITIAVIVVVVLAVMLTVILLILKQIKHPIVLEENLNVEEGFLNASDLQYLVGKEGIASTDLKPAGKCRIEGIEFDVRTDGKYMKKGMPVRICKIHENTIIVEQKL